MRLLWKAWIAALVLLGMFWAIGAAVYPKVGDLGFSFHGLAGGLTIDSVTAGTDAARAGLRAGQTLQVDKTFENAVLLSTLRAGDSITLTRSDGSRFTLIAQPADIPLALDVVVVALRLAFLLVAAIVAWRKPDDPIARPLATFLACYGAAINMSDSLWGGSPMVRFFSLVADVILFVIGLGAVALFACRFPTGETAGWRRMVERSIVPLVAAGIALAVASLAGGVIFHTRIFNTPFTVFYAGTLLVALASLVGSYRGATGADRVRMLWVLGTFGVGFSGLIVQLVGTAVLGTTPPDIAIASISIIAIPIGLAYVILRHRVIDIGFVVNHAVVYTVVSGVIVGAFIVFEWLVEHVVEARGSTSTILQLGAALLLGLSARFIHAHVDRFVDDLFFRERHLAEAAIRRFAHEALLITDPDQLTSKTVEVAQENARLTAVAFYARKNGRYVALRSTFDRSPDVDENDYVVLDMRTWHQRATILDRQTAVPGEIAFPMIVRRELAGFLACGAKRSQEALAPDERDALALLARDAGISLDSLRVRAIQLELDGLSRDVDIPVAVRLRLEGLTATE